MKKEFFNTTEKEVGEKKFNIFIGISLGVLKPLTESLAEDYLKWAIKNSKNKVIILIADEIAKFNYKIFSGYSEGKAYRCAIKEGEIYKDFFEKIKNKLTDEEKEKVIVLGWKDIWDDKKEGIRKELNKIYDSDEEFKEIVLSFVKMYAKKRGKNLTNEKLNYLSQYILAELPTLLDGIDYRGEKYELLLYPTFAHSGMSDFVTKLEEGKIFPSLKREIGLNKSVGIVEFRLPVLKIA